MDTGKLRAAREGITREYSVVDQIRTKELGLAIAECHHRYPSRKWQLSVSSSSDCRLLSCERLLDEAWGTGIALTDRVIDNQIVSLRKKIVDEPTEPRYLSVHGMGYRFDG